MSKSAANKFWDIVDREYKKNRRRVLIQVFEWKLHKNQVSYSPLDELMIHKRWMIQNIKDGMETYDARPSKFQILKELGFDSWYTNLSIRERYFVDGVVTGRIDLSDIPVKVIRGLTYRGISFTPEMKRECTDPQKVKLVNPAGEELVKNGYFYESTDSKGKYWSCGDGFKLRPMDPEELPEKISDDKEEHELPDKLDLDENGHIVGMSLDEIEKRCKAAELPDKLDDLVTEELPDKLEDYREV